MNMSTDNENREKKWECIFPRRTEKEEIGWGYCRESTFSLRIGPDYSIKNLKAPSSPGLYKTIHTRAYQSLVRTPQTTIVDIMPLPALSEVFPDGKIPVLKDERVPHFLILHFQFPYSPGSPFSNKHDGEGAEIIFYAVPSLRFCLESNALFDAATKNDENGSTISSKQVSPATILFTKWCTHCENSLEWRSRFKIMANVKDIKNQDIPRILKAYNGKPVLITKSGKVKRGVTKEGIRYLEMSSNVHKWSYIAKKGFVTLLPKLSKLDLDIGITIEARSDEEMPECILSSTMISKLDPKKLPTIMPTLQKPV